MSLPAAIPQRPSERFVYVIDDDRDIRMSLGLLLSASGWAARPFTSGDDFLDELAHLKPGCIVLDIRMPGRDGISLLTEMNGRGVHWPTIVMTGHAEIPLAVQAMKLGAIEFLEKPFDHAQFEAALERGSEWLTTRIGSEQAAATARDKLGGLTERERAVFDGVIAGESNKAMAARLGLSPRTVEMHRANMMRALGAANLAEVLNLAVAAGIR